jgi:hypothetical protein
MHNWLKRFAILAAVGGSALLGACGGGDDHPGDIVQVAQADARFSILVEAVNAADPAIATALTSPGTLTFFAPTNDAFAALLAELGVTKAQLPANQTILQTAQALAAGTPAQFTVLV